MKFTWLRSIESKLLVTFAIALSSLLPSCSSRLRGLLKKDVWKLRGCDRFWGVEGVRSLFGKFEGMRSLFGKLRGCDCCLGI